MLKMDNHKRPFFRTFRTIYTIKTVDFSGIQIAVESEHADHLMTTQTMFEATFNCVIKYISLQFTPAKCSFRLVTIWGKTALGLEQIRKFPYFCNAATQPLAKKKGWLLWIDRIVWTGIKRHRTHPLWSLSIETRFEHFCCWIM